MRRRDSYFSRLRIGLVRKTTPHGISVATTDFYLLAAQSPGDKWLEAHPQVLGAFILVAAVLNLLFGLALLLAAFIAARKTRNLPPLALIAMYAPGAVFCAIVVVMLLYVAYLFCGGSPSFR